MRNLNMRQKKMLTNFVNQHGVMNVDEMLEEDYQRIYEVNPHETFWSNANRFMIDLENERKYSDHQRN